MFKIRLVWNHYCLVMINACRVNLQTRCSGIPIVNMFSLLHLTETTVVECFPSIMLQHQPELTECSAQLVQGQRAHC